MGRNRKRTALDRYDLAILSALASNTRLSTVELASMVHLSRTAVSRRIAALKRDQILNDAAEVLNYESIGFGVRATVEVSAASQTIRSLCEQLLLEPEVLGVCVVAGDSMLSLDVIATDMDHLHRFIGALQKSGDTSTRIIFTKIRSKLTLVERMRILNERGSGELASV